jgi:hypothetical protein
VEPSEELRVLLRPFATYRVLADELGLTPAAWWRRPLLTLVVLGAAISVTTAGRFVLAHVVLVGAAWAFVPAAQLVALSVVRARFGRHRPLGPTIHVFFAGQGGWLALLVLVVVLVSLAPGLADTLTSKHWILLLAGGALVALVHGFVVTFAFVREVWGVARRPAVLATLGYYLLLATIFLGYFLAMGQLTPLLAGTP